MANVSFEARVRVGSRAQPPGVLGTIPYLSPEQACGSADIDSRSDQFSFGIVLYELAAGKDPSSGQAWR